MATLTIRNLDDDVHARLRIQAAKNGNSVEAEVREVLAEALPKEQMTGAEIVRRMQEIFGEEGGIDDLELPPRPPPRDPPDFSE